jgi:hypothetical protein
LQLPPTREAAIVKELAQRLEDCYAELLESFRRVGYCWRIPNPAISTTSNQGIQAGLLNEPHAV